MYWQAFLQRQLPHCCRPLHPNDSLYLSTMFRVFKSTITGYVAEDADAIAGGALQEGPDTEQHSWL
jgi:hypothetical protein